MKEIKITYADLAIGAFVCTVVAGVFAMLVFGKPTAAIERDLCHSLHVFNAGVAKLENATGQRIEGDWRGSMPIMTRLVCENPNNVDLTDHPDLTYGLTKTLLGANAYVSLIAGDDVDDGPMSIKADFDRAFNLSVRVYHDLGCADDR